MITVREAEQIFRSMELPSRKAQTPLTTALGRVLAEPLLATAPSPPFPNSAMDGFAIRFSDFIELGRDHLFPIVGESAAGHPFLQGAIPKGGAIKISTGAYLPPECDTIIPIEDAIVEEEGIRILSPPKRYQHIKFSGEEFQKDELLLESETLLLPPHLALAASQGYTHVTIYQPPSIALFVTGDELVDYSKMPQNGQIRDSNSPLLSTATIQAGGIIQTMRRLPDNPDAIYDAIKTARTDVDIIITAGGISVGEHDHIRETALQLGFEEIFWKVMQKPGKPFFVAQDGETFLFALPGNPVSAYICFLHYLFPLIRRWYHHPFPSLPRTTAVLESAIEEDRHRSTFLRVKLRYEDQQIIATPLSQQSSYMLRSIASADGYILIEVGKKLETGSTVTVFLFPGNEHFCQHPSTV